jgi:hypothetical protein
MTPVQVGEKYTGRHKIPSGSWFETAPNRSQCRHHNTKGLVWLCSIVASCIYFLTLQ